MRKSWTFFILGIVLLYLLTGCGRSQADTEEGLTIKPVAVMELKEESRPITLHYTGRVEAKDLIKYSFKTSGKIAQIFVEEGQLVKKGDKLALLEGEELKFSLDATKAQMEAAKAQYDKALKGAREEEILLAELDANKARDQYEFVKDYYEKIKLFHENGGASQQELKEAKLKLDQAEISFAQAEKILKLTRDGLQDEDIEVLFRQYEVAKTNFNANEKLMEDSLLIADGDGYVVSILGKESEMAAAGYPVVVLSSEAYRGRIGLTQEDVSKVGVGDEVAVFINQQEVKGTIATINKIPDQESRAYITDIDLMDNLEVNIGAIIEVVISVGMEDGIWIPIKYILNDGEDYVFIVEQGRAKRKNVRIKYLQEDRVLLEGLRKGELLITEGLKSVKEGYEVVLNTKKSEEDRS
ncbi:Multidrug efflux pump subunit AcrA (membrane-fusion protein) [Anaerovirgula multivorans]|uniref:Multidrug efflux pump subunit AcrA (Membrane-fusion protein) n=1 Tax=Anaerovirgula multivorans TaxID=312168 RepID=A0A239JLA4_9FIRM|nr:biotin/lipoyl-binding protein [Anaerovirgula multivorans]SNT06352.1 Multidrug efflux pump subunit AcrA (membrane-fusion protein) [Anaerovirgula multivorans]